MITKLNTKTKKKAKKQKRKIYSNRIKVILEEIEMSQQELADIVQINSAHLSRIINGQRQCVSLPIAIQIAQALKRPVEEVFQVKMKKKEA